MALRLARWLKGIGWLVSALCALTALWLTPSAKHHAKLVFLLACCWVVASLGALFLEQVTKQPDVGRQTQQP